MFRRHQMRNPMGNSLGFSAARACKDKHRSFGVRHSFALLGIKTREEIHYFPFSQTGMRLPAALGCAT
jgi:hypothetical protein